MSCSTSSSQKVTYLSSLCWLGDLGCLSKDLLWGGYYCGCWGMDSGHPLPPSLTSQYYVPTCGQPPALAGEPLWLLDQDSHGWTRGGIAAAAPCGYSSGMVVQCFLCKQLLREDRMSWIASSLCQGLQGSGPGDLLSRYTSW